MLSSKIHATKVVLESVKVLIKRLAENPSKINIFITGIALIKEFAMLTHVMNSPKFIDEATSKDREDLSGLIRDVKELMQCHFNTEQDLIEQLSELVRLIE